MPSWVTPTQWPHDPSATSSQRPPLRRAGPGLRGGGPAAADREGTLVLEGRQHRGHPVGPHALVPVEAGRPPERGTRAVLEG